MIMFEICNNIIENLLMSTFIASYINLQKNKITFIFVTTVSNAILSTLLTHFQIIGFIQTILIQIVLWISLYKLDTNFSLQDIMIALYCNILLFFSVYFSNLTTSFIFNIKPFQIFSNFNTYITMIFLSKSIFILLLVFSIKMKPLHFTKIKISKLKYLLIFELLMFMMMIYYFISFVINESYSSKYNIILLCFIFLFSFCCFILNQFISLNQELYEVRLKETNKKYELANLTNLKNIKYHLDNTEHRINYILQSIQFDLKSGNYDDALKKIETSNDLIYKIPTVICTHNEVFDFMMNLEIKQFISNQKDIKICTFISQNHVYNNIEIINHILIPLKQLFVISNSIELFLSENKLHILEIKYILLNTSEISQSLIENRLKDILPKNYSIKKNDKLITLIFKINLNDYFY